MVGDMTFINEHKILGDDDETTAEVTKNKELLVKGLSGDEKMDLVITLLKKIEYHLSLATDTDLTNCNL